MEVINRFKGLDPVDRVPEEPRTEVRNTVQEAVTRRSPRKRTARSTVVIWGGLTNSWGKKRSDKQGRQGKVYECRIPENCKEKQEVKVKVTQSSLTLCDPKNEACQATLSFTISQSLLKFLSIELVMLSNHLILCHPLLLLPSIFLSQHQSLFQWVLSSHQEAKVLELLLQHQSFQWIFRVDFL